MSCYEQLMYWYINRLKTGLKPHQRARDIIDEVLLYCPAISYARLPLIWRWYADIASRPGLRGPALTAPCANGVPVQPSSRWIMLHGEYYVVPSPEHRARYSIWWIVLTKTCFCAQKYRLNVFFHAVQIWILSADYIKWICLVEPQQWLWTTGIPHKSVCILRPICRLKMAYNIPAARLFHYKPVIMLKPLQPKQHFSDI